MAEQRTASFQSWRTQTQSDGFMPPSKRQRMSPTPLSPTAMSPQSTTFPTYSMLSQSQRSSFNTPQPLGSPAEISQRPAAGTMGPPSRPVEKDDSKATDVRSLFDMASAIGIDEKEEENFLLSSYRQSGDDYFNTPSSQTSIATNSFDQLRANRVNGVNTIERNQLSLSMSNTSPEDEIYKLHKSAARAFGERHQAHLDDPFLWGQSVRGKIQRIATDIGVKIPVEGLFDKIPEKPTNVQGAAAIGSQGAMLELKAPSILNRGAPLEGIVSLISLAANERLRGLLEDAFALARERRTGSDGIVPEEWSALAATPKYGQGMVIGTAKEAVADQSRASHGTRSSQPHSSSQAQEYTTSHKTSLNQLGNALQVLSKRDRIAEELREKKRRARIARKASRSATPGPEGANGDSDLIGGLANGVGGTLTTEVKMTKKERDRLTKADQTEEVLRRAANQTAIGQLGGGKRYSWMTGGSKGSGTGGGLTGRKPGIGGGVTTNGVAAGSSSNQLNGSTKASSGPKERAWGEWRENGDDGRGVQLRDWTSVLEMDGRDKKTLAYALSKLGSEKSAP